MGCRSMDTDYESLSELRTVGPSIAQFLIEFYGWRFWVVSDPIDGCAVRTVRQDTTGRWITYAAPVGFLKFGFWSVLDARCYMDISYSSTIYFRIQLRIPFKRLPLYKIIVHASLDAFMCVYVYLHEKTFHINTLRYYTYAEFII